VRSMTRTSRCSMPLNARRAKLRLNIAGRMVKNTQNVLLVNDMVEFVCVSVSPRIMEKHMDELLQLSEELKTCKFVVETNEIATIFPNAIAVVPMFGKYGRSYEAYKERATRLVKYATQCWCYMDDEDKNMGPITVAVEFKKQHPSYLLSFKISMDGKLQKMGLDDAMKRYRWDG